MGHATHFLERLERVEGQALDLALGLYRDPELLRWVFGPNIGGRGSTVEGFVTAWTSACARVPSS